jgi:drug/metabolite transporter (DMT)-like permease
MPRPGPPRRGLPGAWDRLPPNVRGALCVAFGGCLLILMASLVKHLSHQLPVFEILFMRFLAGLLILLPVLWRGKFRAIRTRRPLLHFTRGFVGFMGNFCFFFALAHIVLADAVTIQFSRPIFMLFVAALLLGEIAGLQRTIVALVGFSGILIITRPFGEGFDPWAFSAVGGAFFGTLVVVTVKLLSRTEQTLTIMFYFAFWTTLLAAIPAFYVWVMPTWTQLGLLILTGAFGIIGQAFFTHGVSLGDTTFVMPFDYLRIVYSAIFGMIWFSEFPGVWSITGAAIIIASSIYLLRAERDKKSRREDKAT